MKFGRLDADVAADRALTPSAKLVYAVLRMFQNPQTGQCNPSRAMLAEATGLHIKSVGRSIKILVDNLYLVVADGQFRIVEREQIVPSDGTNCSLQGNKLLPPEDKLFPPKEQFVPPYNKVEKTNEKTNEKRRGREVIKEPGYIQPTSEQQATAVAMLDRWDALYPHTTTLADRLGDEGALLALQTVHGLSRPDLEQLIEGVDDKIEFWSRPKNLTMHIGRDDDQPLVYRKILSEIQRKESTVLDADFDFIAAKAAKEKAWKNGTY